MARRFCAGCGAEVEDVGGYCLLGHNLRLVPGTLQDIQADIATAFEAASGRMEAAFRLAGLPQTPQPPHFVIEGPPPQAAPPSQDEVATESVPPGEVRAPSTGIDALSAQPPAASTTPDATPAPPPLWGPPPPPEVPGAPPEERAGRWEHLWGAASPEDVLRDPITAFSPPPSMDWGPPKDGKRKLLSRRPGQKSA